MFVPSCPWVSLLFIPLLHEGTDAASLPLPPPPFFLPIFSLRKGTYGRSIMVEASILGLCKKPSSLSSCELSQRPSVQVRCVRWIPKVKHHNTALNSWRVFPVCLNNIALGNQNCVCVYICFSILWWHSSVCSHHSTNEEITSSCFAVVLVSLLTCVFVLSTCYPCPCEHA